MHQLTPQAAPRPSDGTHARHDLENGGRARQQRERGAAGEARSESPNDLYSHDETFIHASDTVNYVT